MSTPSSVAPASTESEGCMPDGGAPLSELGTVARRGEGGGWQGAVSHAARARRWVCHPLERAGKRSPAIAHRSAPIRRQSHQTPAAGRLTDPLRAENCRAPLLVCLGTEQSETARGESARRAGVAAGHVAPDQRPQIAPEPPAAVPCRQTASHVVANGGRGGQSAAHPSSSQPLLSAVSSGARGEGRALHPQRPPNRVPGAPRRSHARETRASHR
eukprot:CAMPEP_0119405810 /NCGR_PEP_ID=MMETSP1335-20130426/366_1 /TAXON_ID=259385 /ORGANISM="Chrysoculter rhomboideus, Strain RCC1486" /LENGTH=214 /DNA_ID=CAMNT_0007429855 /DNA_START=719 /DNA_END=1363 /DNA_ORIENTATION=-